jgi:hypothetical protein
MCNGYKEYRERVDWKIKRQYEHRIIMEQHIWRKLNKNEHVHHINWNKTDNRIENLELIWQKEHLRMHAKQNNFGKDRLWVPPANKLTDDRVKQITTLYDRWENMFNISKIMWISPTTVKKYLLINNTKKWKQ